jgi:hypothetical protein
VVAGRRAEGEPNHVDRLRSIMVTLRRICSVLAMTHMGGRLVGSNTTYEDQYKRSELKDDDGGSANV